MVSISVLVQFLSSYYSTIFQFDHNAETKSRGKLENHI